MQRQRQVVLIPVLALLLSCAGRPIHPGAVDKLDSTAYDALLIAQAVLDEAKAQVKSGKLPNTDAVKSAINRAGAAYDVARLAQKTYHETTAAARSVSAESLLEALRVMDGLVQGVRALTTGAPPGGVR